MKRQSHRAVMNEVYEILTTMREEEKLDERKAALGVAVSAISAERDRFNEEVDEAEQMLRSVIFGNNRVGIESKFAWEYLRKQLNLSQDVLDEVETRLFPEPVK